jgi:Spy/CpxP family protein refolding chaperone
MTVKSIVLGLAVSLAVLFAHVPAFADQAGAHHGHRLQQWLQLSDDQVAQIRAIRARDAASWKQLTGALGEARRELRRMALGGTDAGAIQAKQAEVQQLLGQVVDLRVKHLQEIAPLLTQEQRDKLAEGRPAGRHRGHRSRALAS